MSVDEELDYDDIISQNILIKKDESSEDSASVEVVTKKSVDYELQYNKQAALYQMDGNIHGFLQTVMKQEDEADNWQEEDDASNDSDYEVVAMKESPNSPKDDRDAESSDSDWEVPKKPKHSSRLNFECEECGKRCATKRGLNLHERSHRRQQNREQETILTADG